MVGLSVSLKCDLKDNSFLYLPEGSIKDIDKLLSKNQSGFLESDILETMQDSYFKKDIFQHCENTNTEGIFLFDDFKKMTP